MRLDKESDKGKDNGNDEIEYLNPDTIAQSVYDKLLGSKAIELKEYVMKPEWDIYNDFKLHSKPIPKLYSDVNL